MTTAYCVTNKATKEVKRSFVNLVPCMNAVDKANEKAGSEVYKMAFFVDGKFSHFG